jgi:hypothetical protein
MYNSAKEEKQRLEGAIFAITDFWLGHSRLDAENLVMDLYDALQAGDTELMFDLLDEYDASNNLLPQTLGGIENQIAQYAHAARFGY